MQLEAKLDLLLSNQEAEHKQFLATIDKLAEVSVAQTKVFELWANLFKFNENEPNRNWVPNTNSIENEKYLEEQGMPPGLSDAEQAAWVKKSLGIN